MELSPPVRSIAVCKTPLFFCFGPYLVPVYPKFYRPRPRPARPKTARLFSYCFSLRFYFICCAGNCQGRQGRKLSDCLAKPRPSVGQPPVGSRPPAARPAIFFTFPFVYNFTLYSARQTLYDREVLCADANAPAAPMPPCWWRHVAALTSPCAGARWTLFNDVTTYTWIGNDSIKE